MPAAAACCWQVVDPTEADGHDEALVPNDFNLVVDDDIFEIVRRLPSGAQAGSPQGTHHLYHCGKQGNQDSSIVFI